MTANEEKLNLFTTRMRQLILRFKALKEENAMLVESAKDQDAKIRSLEGQLEQAHRDYESLKIARMIEVSGEDIEEAQKKIAKLIRDVSKCITLLSDK